MKRFGRLAAALLTASGANAAEPHRASLAAPPEMARASPAGGPAVADAAADFETMKALVGTWRPAERPGSPLRIRFSLTAGGSVLVEEWLRGDRPHSMTVYHLDGREIIATHYCPQGNQPRLVSTAAPRAPSELSFAFRDAADLDTAHESYLVKLGFDLSNRERPLRRETYRQAGVDEASELTLMRAP